MCLSPGGYDPPIYTAAEGHLRIWTKDGDEDRKTDDVNDGGDFVTSGEEYDVSKLGFTSTVRTNTFYVEGISNSAKIGDLGIVIEVDPNSGDDEPDFICTDAVTVTVVRVDLDIDSDNNNGLDEPDYSAKEDHIEVKSGLPGKYIGVNDGDVDNNGIPDFASGYDKWDSGANKSTDFVRIKVTLPKPLDMTKAKIKFTYSESGPDRVEKSSDDPPIYTLAEGHMRIWKKDGNEDRKKAEVDSSGDFVKSGEEYDVSKLGFSDDIREKILYVEGIEESATVGDLDIKIEVDPNSSSDEPDSILKDTVNVTVVRVDLDGDMNRDGDVNDEDADDPEEHAAPGLIVRVNNNDDNDNKNVDKDETSVREERDLVKIRLRGYPPDLREGAAVLEAVNTGQKPGRVKVWKDMAKTTLVLDSGDTSPSKRWNLSDSFRIADVPEYLYMEGLDLCSVGCYVELGFGYEDAAGHKLHEDKVLVSVCPDLIDDAPIDTTATDHTGHCLSETYWDILGEKVVGLAVGGGDTLKGMSAGGETPCFVSRTEGSGDEAKTRCFMVADSEYTPWSRSGTLGPLNGELDQYWFRKENHVCDAAGLHNSDSEITLTFPNYRAFDRPVFDDTVISRKAHLYICLYDLDDKGSTTDFENVRVYINGSNPGGTATYLTSGSSFGHRKWAVLDLEFDTSLLKFPKKSMTDTYPDPKMNVVAIALDKLDQGWALEVDWAVIQYDAMSPVFLIHGMSMDASFWDFGFRTWIGDCDIKRAFTGRKYPVDSTFDVRLPPGSAIVPGPGNASIPLGGGASRS